MLLSVIHMFLYNARESSEKLATNAEVRERRFPLKVKRYLRLVESSYFYQQNYGNNAMKKIREKRLEVECIDHYELDVVFCRRRGPGQKDFHSHQGDKEQCNEAV